MQRRESVLLAHVYDESKHNINGWYIAEKYDGFRAWYDGGITRGLLASDVPWCNTAKHERYKSSIKCTGLWTRLMQPIQAPCWFLDQLPPYCLDGELWLGRGRFQDTMSVCKTLEPDSRWCDVKYCIFDIPRLDAILRVGTINNPMLKMDIGEGMYAWALDRWGRMGCKRPHVHYFNEIVDYFYNSFKEGPNVFYAAQIQLDPNVLNTYLDNIVREGGEGLIARHPHSVWNPVRSKELLKIKPVLYGVGKVIGYRAGRGKYSGMMGAYVINSEEHNVDFELSGMDDFERANPLPIGSSVRFKYRDLSDAGVPREARKVN